MTQTSEAAEQVPVSHHTVNERKKICPVLMERSITLPKYCFYV